MELMPGQVWWAIPSPSVGREQAGRRPVLVVSNDDYHTSVTTLALVVPLTTTDRGWPNHVRVEGRLGLERTSYAMTEQVRVISRERLQTLLGIVHPDCLDQIRSWVTSYIAG